MYIAVGIQIITTTWRLHYIACFLSSSVGGLTASWKIVVLLCLADHRKRFVCFVIIVFPLLFLRDSVVLSLNFLFMQYVSNAAFFH